MRSLYRVVCFSRGAAQLLFCPCSGASEWGTPTALFFTTKGTTRIGVWPPGWKDEWPSAPRGHVAAPQHALAQGCWLEQSEHAVQPSLLHAAVGIASSWDGRVTHALLLGLLWFPLSISWAGCFTNGMNRSFHHFCSLEERSSWVVSSVRLEVGPAGKLSHCSFSQCGIYCTSELLPRGWDTALQLQEEAEGNPRTAHSFLALRLV